MAPAPAVDQLTLEQQVCFTLSVADRRVVGVYRPLLEPLGLTHPQYLVMIALWQYAPVPMRRLGRLLALDSGTLSPLIKRLEVAGLVVREKGPDERSVTIDLTDRGWGLREQARSVPDGVLRRLGLELSELYDLRDRLVTLIAAATAAPSEDAAAAATDDRSAG